MKASIDDALKDHDKTVDVEMAAPRDDKSYNWRHKCFLFFFILLWLLAYKFYGEKVNKKLPFRECPQGPHDVSGQKQYGHVQYDDEATKNPIKDEGGRKSLYTNIQPFPSQTTYWQIYATTGPRKRASYDRQNNSFCGPEWTLAPSKKKPQASQIFGSNSAKPSNRASLTGP